MRSAPPKTLGGYRNQNFTPPVTGGAPNNLPMHLNRRADNIPLFIRCGAYRALLELKMLWPYVIFDTFDIFTLPRSGSKI